jgi:hypothetical protein
MFQLEPYYFDYFKVFGLDVMLLEAISDMYFLFLYNPQSELGTRLTVSGGSNTVLIFKSNN